MTIEDLYRHDLAPALQHLLCRPSLDALMQALSTAGEGWFLLPLAVGLAWSVARDRRAALHGALRFLTILVVTGALATATKRLVQAPRPLQLLGPERVRILIEPLRLMSFPSGHSALAAAAAFWAAREPGLAQRGWPWLFAFLCGLSRVYVGAHWVTDVVAGWLLGTVVAALVYRAWPAPRGAAMPAGAGEVSS